MDWLANPTRYIVKSMPIVNSRYSDFSPAFGNKEYTEIYFASSRKGSTGTEVDERTGESFMDIYKTRIDKKGKWTFEELNKFLYKPKEFIKGTKMNFAGLKNVEDRANLILWLQQHSDNPVPLPE